MGALFLDEDTAIHVKFMTACINLFKKQLSTKVQYTYLDKQIHIFIANAEGEYRPVNINLEEPITG